MYQSINQSINQTTNQSVNQSTVLYCTSLLYNHIPCNVQFSTGLRTKKSYHPSLLHKNSPNSPVTDISLTERQSLGDDHITMALRLFSLPLGIGSRGLPCP